MWKVLFAVIYGLVFINYIDIAISFNYKVGYHLWLILMYFMPFILTLNVKECLTLGLIASLCNDLFFYPLSNLIAGMNYDILETYMFQLGFQLFRVRWIADLLFIKISVSSIIMGITIYVRIAVVLLLMKSKGKKKIKKDYNP